MTSAKFIIAAAIAAFSLSAVAKLPPAPPVDPKAAEEKAAKDKVAAEKAKVLQAKYEDSAAANYRANMKKTGMPIPKPTPIVVAAAPAAPALVPVPAAAAAKPAVAAPTKN